MFSLSVVVISKNEEAHIGRCLRSILAAAEEVGGAEVVLVDSASTDRTVEIALSLGMRVLSLRPEWELSPAAGRYVGFHHTRGDLIMFVDADTVIERDWLRHAVPYFERPEVAGVAGFLDDVDEQGQPLPYVGQRSSQPSEVKRLRGIALYRRAALVQAGTFNPYLITEEEAELAFRLRGRGFRLLQLPHPMGCHLRGAVLHNELLRMWRLGRFKGDSLTLRYALRTGGAWQFCFELLKPTLFFVLACCSLFGLGIGLLLAGNFRVTEAVFFSLAAGFVALAIKKRSLLGPVTYAATHLLVLYGLVSGALTTRVKDPEDYPLEVIEESLLYRGRSPIELSQHQGSKVPRVKGNPLKVNL